jgi:short-subunit dehydrogenase
MTQLRRVLITGASSGIGFAAAELFAEKGWHVIACTRHGEGHPAHPAIRALAMDVDDASSVEDCFRTLQHEGLNIDVIVNNAGHGLRLPFESMSDEEVLGMFQTNVLGTMRVTRAWLASEPKRGSVLINVGSLAGHMGMLYHSVYCATKHALEGWSESLAYELEPLGIAVKLVEPMGRVSSSFQAKASALEQDRTIPLAHEARYRAYALKVAKAPSPLTSRDIAQDIYEAATDGSTALRRYRWPGFSVRAQCIIRRMLPSYALRLMALRYRRAFPWPDARKNRGA